MYKYFLLMGLSFTVFIAWIIFQANTGGNNIFFDIMHGVPYGDKFGHFGLFGTLTMFAIIISRFSYFRVGRLKIYYGALVISVFVICEEVSQAFIPSRTFDLVDLVAGGIGIALFTLLTIKLKQLSDKKTIKHNQPIKDF
ncbi:VanZ family protein [Shewanella donghaensis]|uniref:VanZ family protein n=1 Tax=Shewanella donghaensis TaxID=238836 RepID=UPI0014566BE3|nr:VanZ family protein [Shewanella donghaensis]